VRKRFPVANAAEPIAVKWQLLCPGRRGLDAALLEASSNYLALHGLLQLFSASALGQASGVWMSGVEQLLEWLDVCIAVGTKNSSAEYSKSAHQFHAYRVAVSKYLCKD